MRKKCLHVKINSVPFRKFNFENVLNFVAIKSVGKNSRPFICRTCRMPSQDCQIPNSFMVGHPFRCSAAFSGVIFGARRIAARPTGWRNEICSHNLQLCIPTRFHMQYKRRQQAILCCWKNCRTSWLHALLI